MRRSLTFFALLAILPSAFAQELSADRAKVLDQVSSVLKTSAFVPGIDLTRWDQIAAESKPKFAAAKDDAEFAREVNVALRKFGASHFRFLTPREETRRRTNQNIGLGLTTRKEKDGLRVVAVAPTSPADKAGIRSGDVVTKVNGQAAVATALEGEEGKSVKVLLKGHKEQELKFAKYSLRRPATLTKIDETTALFRLPTFSNGYDRAEVEKCITDATKYPNLIIDLRSNGGGAVVSLQHFLSLFMPSSETVGTFVTKPLVSSFTESTKSMGAPDVVQIAHWSRYSSVWRTRQIKPLNREAGPLYKGNIVVLVNRGSASASEICASAMHDVLGADVVGTKSMGAVLVSVFRPLMNGYALQYPTSDYVTVRDRRLEANPIVPVVEDQDANAEVVKATYLAHRAQLRKERFGG